MSGRLIGVIHLAPLPGSPTASLPLEAIAIEAREDARVLEEAGFDAVIVENYGDVPFLARAEPVTIAAMTAVAMRVRDACPRLTLGVNVLRNDADAALAIASVVGATFIRVNVHSGARVTDQGVIEGQAGRTLRARRALSATNIEVWADVDVKHSAPLGVRSVADEARDATDRGLAGAVLVTGEGTGRPVDREKLRAVRSAVSVPVYVASGALPELLPSLAEVSDGVIVGSALRANGRAGGRVDPVRAASFARAFREAYSTR